ncbi:MAG: exodeoxyribonuclease VII large subunit [Bacillaceae bacterium]|nr:MAG: exodeoxyribonuclease VII large subunit [Bacillaceae bacterium]
MSNKKFVTVSALTKYLKRKFDVDPHLRDIWVKGELSNVKIHDSGHIYFTLKDEHARIQAVMFSSFNRSLPFRPEDGMNVLVRGEITIYQPGGIYQIYAKAMEPDGVGGLYLAFEQLKKKLEQEGLFDVKHKKTIPAFPKTIGVITSPTGAAVRDIITTIKRRYPVAKVVVIPAIVQGVQAGKSIVNKIQLANSLGYFDVLIVGRGGGSIEELWAFNEEMVAREIFKSKIPVISAVGHETDYTIADFVADLRAPTPTGAAELAVPNITDLIEKIRERNIRMTNALKERIKKEKLKLFRLTNSYAFKYPKKLYMQKEQELDILFERFKKAGKRYLSDQTNRYLLLTNRLKNELPNDQIERAKTRMKDLDKKMLREMTALYQQKLNRFQALASKLDALSPLKIMERGYSLVYKQDKLVKSVKQTAEGDFIQIKLQDGTIHCEVSEIEERRS